MDSLPTPLTEAKVILLCGVSGSGKTRLARALGPHGFTRLSSDVTAWAINGGDFSGLPWPRQQELFRETAARLDEELALMLDEGKKVVVDSTLCKRARRDRLTDICRAHGLTPLLVFLEADAGTLAARLARRHGLGPDDLVVTPGQLSGFLAGFEMPAPEEHPYRFRPNDGSMRSL